MSKVFLITGAASGFGRALSEAALNRGHRVIATARKPEELQPLCDLHPESVRAVPLDVTDPASIRQGVLEAHKAWGRLDVVINNAGLGLLGALEEAGDEQITRCLQTNLLGPIHLIRAVLPILRAQRSGHIINMAAIAGFYNELGFGVYGAAKAALESLSESMHAELAPLGIKVTVVIPGPFRTSFIQRSLLRVAAQIPEYQAHVAKFCGMVEKLDGKQIGDPAKAAELILDVVDSPEPPLRLLLGRYAYRQARTKLAKVAAEMDAWEARGTATDLK